MEFININHSRRLAMGLGVAQYAILSYIFNKTKVWLADGAVKIANELCLSEGTVSAMLLQLEELGYLEMMPDNRQMKRPTERAAEFFEAQYPAAGGKKWGFTCIQLNAMHSLRYQGYRLKLTEYVYLDLIAHTMAISAFGGVGRCNHTDEMFGKLLCLERSGMCKMRNKLTDMGLISGTSGNLVANDIFMMASMPMSMSDLEHVLSAEKAADSEVNDAIRAEVLWRLEREIGPQEMIDLFPGEEIPEVSEQIADDWIASGKEIVPHKKSGRAKDWPYQNCLRGFKTWVSTYARNRGGQDRKVAPSARELEMAERLITVTARAYGRPTHLIWKKKDWEPDPAAVARFARLRGFPVEAKRKYLACCAMFRGESIGHDLNRVLSANISASEMNLFLDMFEEREHVGRPWPLDHCPPTYVQKATTWERRNWRTDAPKDYFVAHDKENPPVYHFGADGSPLDDWYRDFWA